MSFRPALQALATTFVNGLLEEIQHASLDELLDVGSGAPKARPAKPVAWMPLDSRPAANGHADEPARLKRRSLEEVRAAVAAVATLLRKHSSGMRSEQIRLERGLDVREMPRILRQGLADKQIRILSGQKRSTVYAASITIASPKRASKKVSRKVSRKASRKPSSKKTSRKKKAHK